MRKRPGLRKRGRYWHISISHCGHEVRRSLETGDDKEAEQLYDKIRAELWQQRHLNKTPQRLWEEAALAYTEHFDRLVLEGRRKAGSLDTHRLAWLSAKLNGTPLSAITKKSVMKLLKDQPSPRHYSAIVSAVLHAAVAEDYLTAAPPVIFGGNSEARERWLTEGEARTLMAQSGLLGDAILFSLATGLRQANALGLQWAWISDRTVTIPAKQFKQNRTHVIPLNRTAMECIRRQLGKHSEYVFTLEGKPLVKMLANRVRPTKAWQAAWEVARAGLADFRWHDLRHTWASWSVQNGVPEPAVEALGGWATGKMVRRYAHASVESLRAYAEALDPVLSRVQPHKNVTEGVTLSAVK